MLRDPNLIPLSQQHHNGLALCVLTRRGLRQDASPAAVAKLARRAVDRFDIELVNHFEIEEQILFPALRRHMGDLPLIAELIGQHRELERIFERLRTGPSAELLEQMCALLTAHIRREENELFQQAQAQVPEAVLGELGVAIESKVVRVCL
jgi:hemerythrin-like domain-containing protein